MNHTGIIDRRYGCKLEVGIETFYVPGASTSIFQDMLDRISDLMEQEQGFRISDSMPQDCICIETEEVWDRLTVSIRMWLRPKVGREGAIEMIDGEGVQTIFVPHQPPGEFFEVVQLKPLSEHWGWSGKGIVTPEDISERVLFWRQGWCRECGLPVYVSEKLMAKPTASKALTGPSPKDPQSAPHPHHP